MNDKHWMILEYNLNDPSQVTLRRVTAEEYMEVWIEEHLPLFENMLGCVARLSVEQIKEIHDMTIAKSEITREEKAKRRSKQDRQRKSRPGKYRWGGPSDE